MKMYAERLQSSYPRIKMASQPAIRKLSVSKLHGHISFELSFNDSLNILYGKNGRGKTTILHIIANLLELDFPRFSKINFEEIKIENSQGRVVCLNKTSKSELPIITIDDREVSYGRDNEELSEFEASELREILGSYSTYLPAFRSVLERSRNSYRYSSRDRHASDDFIEKELKILRDAHIGGKFSPMLTGNLREKAINIAEKTIRCREWFGGFIPIIRYPSILDVEQGLDQEWRLAQIEINSREENMFRDFFVNIFKSISLIDTKSDNIDVKQMVNEIRILILGQEDFLSGESGEILETIYEHTENINNNDSRISNLLDVYRIALKERKLAREEILQDLRAFEAAVNSFLDGKIFSIQSVDRKRFSPRSPVNIEHNGGQQYGLSALSSGERQIITMLYSASRTPFSDGIFLIDEPEISLHVDWQRNILGQICKLHPDRQIIVCTHSPEVGADFLEWTQDFEPASLFDDDDFDWSQINIDFEEDE